MKRFTVSFWYYTDCRTEAVVEAPNELAALVLGMAKASIEHWCGSPGFHVRIDLT